MPLRPVSTDVLFCRGQDPRRELRHRWGIESGGQIGFIDLGDAALVVPGGVEVARYELRRVLRDRYAHGIAAINDPDLADQ
jgi:hypothetical protein